jgi:hypothetical protein
MDQASQLKLTEIKEKVGSLERLLERDVARPGPATSPYMEKTLPDDVDDDLPGAEDEKNLEPTQLAVSDAAYDEDSYGDDGLLDLGIKIGRMRITERIGGFFRPKMAAEVCHPVNTWRESYALNSCIYTNILIACLYTFWTPKQDVIGTRQPNKPGCVGKICKHV